MVEMIWQKQVEETVVAIAGHKCLCIQNSSRIQGTPLPKAEGGVRAASPLGGRGPLLTGIDRSVLAYNPGTEEWVELGTTKTRFWMHATVAGDLARLCHWIQSTDMKKSDNTDWNLIETKLLQIFETFSKIIKDFQKLFLSHYLTIKRPRTQNRKVIGNLVSVREDFR